MILRINTNLAFKITDRAQAETLRDYLVPLIGKAVNINEGLENEEISFIEARECNHDDPTRTIPDKILARWEVGKGRVI